MTDVEEARYHLSLLKEALKVKSGPSNFGAPKLVVIDHDDYHAEHIGNANGRQFFLTTPFAWDQTLERRIEYVALYLFDFDGNLVEAHIDQVEGSEECRRSVYNKRLNDLGKVIFGQIEIKPFAVERFGKAFGLIPRPPHEDDDADDVWAVELLPGNYMAFFEPWDGGLYDT